MYISLANFLFFCFSAFVLAITPGVDVVFIASQSMIARKNGILATLGTMTGIAIYILLTILGLSVVLQHSMLLYNSIKIVGALYLLYLAYLSFRAENTIGGGKILVNKVSGFASYKKGFLTNILNPKIGVFFVTFLPQFVSTQFGHDNIQFALLGISFLLIGGTVNTCYAILFSTFKGKLFQKITFMKILNKVVAVIFCLMAIKIIIT